MILPDAAFLHRLADLADAETLPRYRTDIAVETKVKEGYSFDPVTEADRAAEAAIRAEIAAHFPDHAILGEELGLTGSGRIQWVLDRAILHTTSPEHFGDDLAPGFARLTAAVRMIRYGGECYAMAMIAAGRIDLAIEPSLQPYDIVALIPIIERAGGVVTRLDGGRAEEGGAVLVSATPALHAEALRILG